MLADSSLSPVCLHGIIIKHSDRETYRESHLDIPKGRLADW
jgi:hypothetical protein